MRLKVKCIKMKCFLTFYKKFQLKESFCDSWKMNFKQMVVFLVLMLACSTAVQAARLGFNGGIHAADKYGYVDPKVRALMVKMLRIKRCKSLGRFCWKILTEFSPSVQLNKRNVVENILLGTKLWMTRQI